MRKNQLLSEQIIAAITPYCANLEYAQSTSVQITTNVEIENGEDMIGYQYLHGTNSDVGGFSISGKLKKLPNGDVNCDLTLIWKRSMLQITGAMTLLFQFQKIIL